MYRGKLGLPGIAALLRDLNADAILLQEVLRGEHAPGVRDQAAELAEALGGYFAYTADGLGERDGHRYGDPAILSRLKLADVRLLRSEEGGRPYALCGRVDAPGRPLFLISVHCHGTFRFDLQHIAESMSVRMRQTVELIDLVASLEGEAIVGGDFNAPDWSIEYALMCRHWTDVAQVPGHSARPTFPAVQPMLRIDHMFSAGEWRAARFEISERIVSDHRAIVAHLQRISRK